MSNPGNGSSNGSRWFRVLDEPRDWEDFYRKRWTYDRSVRTGPYDCIMIPLTKTVCRRLGV